MRSHSVTGITASDCLLAISLSFFPGEVTRDELEEVKEDVTIPAVSSTTVNGTDTELEEEEETPSKLVDLLHCQQ